MNSDRLFIDDMNGHWYLVDDKHRGAWAEFKERWPDELPLVEVHLESGMFLMQRNPKLPEFCKPIFRNKPRALTFIGAKVEEWT